MKIQTQAIVGFIAGAVIAIGVLLITPPRTPYYSSAILDGNTLKTLYNTPNFSKLTLDFTYNSSRQRFELVPGAVDNSGARVTIDPKLLVVSNTGNSIGGSRTLVSYNLEHYTITNKLMQLQTLTDIVTKYPGSYFTLEAADYNVIDRTDFNHIYYVVKAFDRNKRPINVGDWNLRAFELDPCPPGHSW